jgi:hypothetical protein
MHVLYVLYIFVSELSVLIYTGFTGWGPFGVSNMFMDVFTRIARTSMYFG